MGGVEGVGGSKPRCREGFEIVNNRGKSKIHWGATTRVNITVDLNILRAEQHRPVPYSRKTRGKPARFPFRKKRVWSKRTTLFIATNNSRCFDVSMFRCFDASMLRCFPRIGSALLPACFTVYIFLFSCSSIFFKSQERSILKLLDQWYKDWFSWCFPLEKKCTRIKGKMKDGRVYLLGPFLRDHGLKTVKGLGVYVLVSPRMYQHLFVPSFSAASHRFYTSFTNNAPQRFQDTEARYFRDKKKNQKLGDLPAFLLH